MIIHAMKENLATTNTYVDFYMEPSPMSSKQGFQQVFFLYLKIFEDSFLFYTKDWYFLNGRLNKNYSH